MAKRMTELFVRTIRAQHARAEFRDGHTRGLVLRVMPNGTKTWAVIYRRKSDARKRRYTFGTYPAISLADARTQAQAALAAIARGEDPAGGVQARAKSLTFAQLAEAWVGRHGRPNKSPRALYDDQLMLNRDIDPAIGAMKADEVLRLSVALVQAFSSAETTKVSPVRDQARGVLLHARHRQRQRTGLGLRVSRNLRR